MTSVFTHAKATWASGTARWMRRWVKQALPSVSIKKAVQKVAENSRLDADKSKGMLSYDEYEFESTRKYLHTAGKLNLGCDRGLKGLLAARTGGLMTGDRAARQGLIRSVFKNKCPCCGCVGPETLEHMFLDCAAWSEERDEFVTPVTDLAPIMLKGHDLLIVLLGGAARGFGFGRQWAIRHEDGMPLFVTIAHFFERIFTRRAGLLWGSASTTRSRGHSG